MIIDALQGSDTASEELIASLADSIHRRGLVAPAMVLLETLSPVSFVFGQLLILLEPLTDSLLGCDTQRYITLFMDRHTMRSLLRVLEADSRPPGEIAEGTHGAPRRSDSLSR